MKLLIAYDGSECARATLDDLKRAGLPDQCTALLLSVVDAWLPPPGDRSDAELPGLVEARRRIGETANRLRAVADAAAATLRSTFPRWTVLTEAVIDSPPWAIIKRAEGSDGGIAGGRADLVVVGSHGHGGFKRFMLGSVSQKVVTQVRCSTRIARPRPQGAGPADPIRLLVGVDGSAGSRAAVEAIAARKWPAGTEVTVLAADEAPLIVDPIAGVVPIPPNDDYTRAIADKAAQRLAAAGLTVDRVSEVGLARQLLLDHASEDRTDCIFVGARGVRAVERFLLGSVSTAVAMNAPCSVEIVHAP